MYYFMISSNITNIGTWDGSGPAASCHKSVKCPAECCQYLWLCRAPCTYWISNGWYLKSEQRAKQSGIFSSLKCLNTSDGRGHGVGGGGVGAEVLLLHKVTMFRVSATGFLRVIPIPNININVMSFVCNWLGLYFLQIYGHCLSGMFTSPDCCLNGMAALPSSSPVNI